LRPGGARGLPGGPHAAGRRGGPTAEQAWPGTGVGVGARGTPSSCGRTWQTPKWGTGCDPGDGRPTGESAQAPAVPTGSTAIHRNADGGGHQPRGPKIAPQPNRTSGPSVQAQAPTA